MVNFIAVSCGGFCGQLPLKSLHDPKPPNSHNLQGKPEERLKLQLELPENGPTIIYVPTRKETLSIAKYLGKFGVKAAAYNAKVGFSSIIESCGQVFMLLF